MNAAGFAAAIATAALLASVPGALRAQGATGGGSAPTPAAAAAPEPWLTRPALVPPDYRLAPRQIAPRTWVVEGAVADFERRNGCNIINTGFIATGAGVVVINTGVSRRYGEQLRAAIAKVTAEPIVRVINLNLHPDYFLGNQAFTDRPLQAEAATIAGQRREGGAYVDNLFRLCGDWMRDTESVPAREPIGPGRLRVGSHELELVSLSGHTDADLVVLDRGTGVMFAGGLAFLDRVPTTPHARLAAWIDSLDRLNAIEGVSVLVPSHGPVEAGRRAITQTRDWLTWLDETFKTAAARGLEMNEVLRLPVPQRFAHFAALKAEYARSVHHLYPSYERAVLMPVTK